MIAKKSSRLNLEKKRIVLFQIGLLTAGSFVLAAFAWESPSVRMYEETYVAHNGNGIEVQYEVIEPPKVTPIEIEVPKVVDPAPSTEPSVAAVSQQITATTSSTKIPDPMVGPVGILPPGTGDLVLVPNDDAIDPFPPISAEYIGGHGAMVQRIVNSLVYPQIDVEMGVQGKAYISFVVEKDGSVSNVRVERGVSSTIDREAVRIIKNFPKWKPAENLNGKVRTVVRLPINFELTN